MTRDLIESFKKKDAIEEVEGIIFRIYPKDRDDETMFLEISDPPSLLKKYSWKEFHPRKGKEVRGLYNN